MSRLAVLLLVLVASGCGGAHRSVVDCQGNPVPPPPTGWTSYATAQRCGRVFDRTALAVVEQQLQVRLAGIECSQAGGYPFCLGRTDDRICFFVALDVKGLAITVIDSQLTRTRLHYCDVGLP